MREKAITAPVGQWLLNTENLTQNISKSGAKIIQIVGQFSAILATESKLNCKNISDKYVHRNIEFCNSASESI